MTPVEADARKEGAILIFEGLIAGQWMLLAFQRVGDPPATISDNHDGRGRDVYVTEAFNDHATIKMLPGGIDIVHSNGTREVDPVEIERAVLLHRLGPGQTVRLTIKPDGAPRAREIRYRYEAKL